MSQSMLERLEAAHKSITRDSLGESILTPEKQGQFVRTVTKTTPILDQSRRIDMKSHTYEIDRISLPGPILMPAEENVEVDQADGPSTHTNKLRAEELGGWFFITDNSLEDNIEKGQLENTIIDMAGNRVGIDLAELFLNGDTNSSDPRLAQLDGWMKLAANKIDASMFDPEDVEDLFARLIEVMDKTYLRNPADWTIWTSWNTADHYRDTLRGRNTGLGDTAQTTAGGLAFKGFEVAIDPSLPEGSAMLSPSDNLVWGVYRDVRIEPERKPKRRRTDYTVTLRADANFEDENAVVVAEGYTGPVAGGGGADEGGE